MIECPNCKEPTIRAWRKQFLAPLRKIPCPSCGALISVDWLHSTINIVVAWLLPVIAIVIFAKFGLGYAVAFFLLGLLAVGIYQHFVVRLRVRSMPDPE